MIGNVVWCGLWREEEDQMQRDDERMIDGMG